MTPQQAPRSDGQGDPPDDASSARRRMWLRVAGGILGFLLAVPALRWLVVNELRDNPMLPFAVVAVVGVLLLFVSLLGWKHGLQVGGGLAALLATILTVVELGNDPAQPQPPTTTTSTPVACPVLARTVDVRPEANLERFGLAFPQTSVEVTGDPGGWLYRRFGGAITGTVPPGYRLVLVGWADPSTRDSTPEHKRGSDLYLVAEVVDPNPDGCWGTKRSRLAYSGAKGLAFEYTFTLVPDAIMSDLDAYRRTAEYERTGLKDEDFRRFGLQRLATFRVETA
jgi:hypothetical protein